MPVGVGSVKIDSEVENLDQNIISVGSPCNNAISAKIRKNPTDCTDGLKPDQGRIRIYPYKDYVHMVVSGFGGKEIIKAANVLADYKNYNLKGTEYIVYTKNQEPIGYLKKIDSKGFLKGIITGVATDADHPNVPIPINVFIDGGPGVGKAYGFNTNDAGYFSMQVPINYWDGKNHLVYAYAVDIDDPTGNSNRELNGSPQLFSLTNQPPTGYLDGVTADGVISGWAIDPDDTNKSIIVHLWLDNPAGSGIVVNAYEANVPRPDVNKDVLIDGEQVFGNHGFNIMLPSQYKSQPRKIYVYGIDAQGQPEKNILLQGSPKDFPPK